MDLSKVKIYDVDVQPDGNVKVVTEFTPEEMKAVLSVGLITLLMSGFVPPSVAHHFENEDDEQQAFLDNIPVDELPRA